MIATPPTLAGFQNFLFQPGPGSVPVNELLTSNPVISTAYAVSIEIVNLDIQLISPLMYALAVYNLATDSVYNYAQDIVPNPDPVNYPQGFFTTMRQSMGLLDFVAGVHASGSDEGTSEALLNPEFMKDLKMADLQTLKTPWGRQYMSIAQRYGGVVAFS